MLTPADLEALLTDLESDRVGRKASVSDAGKIRQAICAFANDPPGYHQPGVVLVGVQDDGSCANSRMSDDLLLTLAGMRDDGNIQPFPIMSVRRMTLLGCDMAVVEVQPAYNPPVRFNGRAWVRVGPRRATASADEERRLTEKRRSGNLPAAIAPDVLEENDRSVEQQLASLRFLTKGGHPEQRRCTGAWLG